MEMAIGKRGGVQLCPVFENFCVYNRSNSLNDFSVHGVKEERGV